MHGMVFTAAATPTGWMSVSDDQHHRPQPSTPGITGMQVQSDWLSPLRAAVRLLSVLADCYRRYAPVPPLAAVSWLQARLTLYDRGDRNSLLALVEAS